MQVDWEIEEDIAVLWILESSIDTPSLVKDFHSLLKGAGSGYKKVLLDLSSVTFMNSLAIRVIIDITEFCRSREVTFKLCGLRPEIFVAIRFLRIQDIIPIYNTREEALLAFQ